MARHVGVDIQDMSQYNSRPMTISHFVCLCQIERQKVSRTTWPCVLTIPFPPTPKTTFVRRSLLGLTLHTPGKCSIDISPLPSDPFHCSILCQILTKLLRLASNTLWALKLSPSQVLSYRFVPPQF